jgi:hypothetical protein
MIACEASLRVELFMVKVVYVLLLEGKKYARKEEEKKKRESDA